MLEYKRKFSHTHFGSAGSTEQHAHSRAQCSVDGDGATRATHSRILEILHGTWDNYKHLKRDVNLLHHTKQTFIQEEQRDPVSLSSVKCQEISVSYAINMTLIKHTKLVL